MIPYGTFAVILNPLLPCFLGTLPDAEFSQIPPKKQAIRNAAGGSYSSSAPGETTCGNTTSDHHSRREEDTASAPLDVLQLGVSLGLPKLSAAAARAVLLQLDRVSTSEAFEASGMSKRELVVAALEAIRS